MLSMIVLISFVYYPASQKVCDSRVYKPHSNNYVKTLCFGLNVSLCYVIHVYGGRCISVLDRLYGLLLSEAIKVNNIS